MVSVNSVTFTSFFQGSWNPMALLKDSFRAIGPLGVRYSLRDSLILIAG